MKTHEISDQFLPCSLPWCAFVCQDPCSIFLRYSVLLLYIVFGCRKRKYGRQCHHDSCSFFALPLLQTNVSGNQWLFNTQLSGYSMPAVCLRSDVDACVWQPREDQTATAASASAFQCEHVATFHALGYVSASKQQKKFMACPPDASYGVICECTRNVFIYYPQENGHDSNRALQAIFSLPLSDDTGPEPPSDEAILGIVALPSLRVVVLTEHNVYLLTV